MIQILADAGIKYLLAFLVIVLYALFKVLDHIKKGQFDMNIFIKDNKPYWLWTMITVFVILLIITIEPDAGGSIKSLTGLDVNETRTSFLTLGWGLSILINNSIKNPVGKKTMKKGADETPQL